MLGVTGLSCSLQWSPLCTIELYIQLRGRKQVHQKKDLNALQTVDTLRNQYDCEHTGKQNTANYEASTHFSRKTDAMPIFYSIYCTNHLLIIASLFAILVVLFFIPALNCFSLLLVVIHSASVMKKYLCICCNSNVFLPNSGRAGIVVRVTSVVDAAIVIVASLFCLQSLYSHSTLK